MALHDGCSPARPHPYPSLVIHLIDALNRLRGAEAEQRRLSAEKVATLTEAARVARESEEDEAARQEAAKNAADAVSELEELQCSTFWRGVAVLSAQDFKVRGGSEISFMSMSKRKSMAQQKAVQAITVAAAGSPASKRRLSLAQLGSSTNHFALLAQLAAKDAAESAQQKAEDGADEDDEDENSDEDEDQKERGSFGDSFKGVSGSKSSSFNKAGSAAVEGGDDDDDDTEEDEEDEVVYLPMVQGWRDDEARRPSLSLGSRPTLAIVVDAPMADVALKDAEPAASSSFLDDLDARLLQAASGGGGEVDTNPNGDSNGNGGNSNGDGEGDDGNGNKNGDRGHGDVDGDGLDDSKAEPSEELSLDERMAGGRLRRPSEEQARTSAPQMTRAGAAGGRAIESSPGKERAEPPVLLFRVTVPQDNLLPVNLDFLSVFPNEAEVVYPPGVYLEQRKESVESLGQDAHGEYIMGKIVDVQPSNVGRVLTSKGKGAAAASAPGSGAAAAAAASRLTTVDPA